MKILLILALFVTCFPVIIFGQNYENIIENNFTQVTGILLPEIFKEYKKSKVENLKESNNSFLITYLDENTKFSKITINVYPADVALENRLLFEYRPIINSYSERTSEIINQPIKVTKDSINMLGLISTFTDYERNYNTVLAMFEAGKFFIKYEIKSRKKSIEEIVSITKSLIDTISPTIILKNNPLILGVTIHIAPGVVQDTNSLDPIIKATLTKAEWVYNNVDSIERCGGFPSLYFLEQKLTVEAMLAEWENKSKPKAELESYFNELIKIRNSGFLDEYIYEEYDRFLLLPENMKLRMEDFFKWRKANKLTVTLTGPTFYYVLGYEGSYKN